MIKFCPKCNNLLRKKITDKKFVYSCACGYSEPFEEDIKEKEMIAKNKIKKYSDKTIVLPDINAVIYPITNAECRKCGNKEVEYWQSQTRSADEGSTTFFRCTKCKFTWREY